jgi:hypothetical protein
MSGRQANGTERPAALARCDRSQSPHSTAAARAARSAESKAAPREGGQEGGSGKDGMRHERASAVPERATQGAEARDWSWVEASVWTDRMVSALVNGVKGGRWYSLMDKVFAPAVLDAAWDRVWANDGAAGVDGQSIERYAAGAELYLTELTTALREGRYRPQPIKRVEIPKGDGKTRPLGIPTVKDRIVQTAVKFVLEAVFEATFHPTSYGFRPGRVVTMRCAKWLA